MMKKISTKGISKQDLAAQKAALKEAQKAANAQLRAFRHDVAQLKKKGLLDKAYDARKVKPTRYLKTQLKRFADVLSGEAQPVKVSKEKAAKYAAQGYKVKAGRVVVPKAKNEKVYAAKEGFRIKTTTKTGSITRIDTGLHLSNLQEWEKALRSTDFKLKKDERIAFQLYGNNSYQTFIDVEHLLMRLQNYATYEQVEASNDPDKQEQFITNVVIFKFQRGTKMPETGAAEEMRAARLAKQAAVRREYVERMTPERREKYNTQRAEVERKRRERKKKQMTPEQIEAEKEKARQRAKKSYSERSV
jgi:hypothetical protein